MRPWAADALSNHDESKDAKWTVGGMNISVPWNPCVVMVFGGEDSGK